MICLYLLGLVSKSELGEPERGVSLLPVVLGRGSGPNASDLAALSLTGASILSALALWVTRSIAAERHYRSQTRLGHYPVDQLIFRRDSCEEGYLTRTASRRPAE